MTFAVINLESTPKSLSSLIFNFLTPDPPAGGNSLKINELFKVPFSACPDLYREDLGVFDFSE
jgi:hypothetical protein